LIYDGAVDDVLGSPLVGDLVEVIDANESVLAWGFFHPKSLYTVRVLAREGFWKESSDPTVYELLLRRLELAKDTRHLLGLPKPGEDEVYRLVNSEGDLLSGLNVDVYGNVALVRAGALWIEKHRADVEKALQKVLAEVPDLEIVWQRSLGPLKKDGVEVMDDGTDENSDEFQVFESGLRFFVSPGRGQKYFPQRENRKMIRELLRHQEKPPRVLDLCCYHGGFAISAAAGGAAEVVAVDSSKSAVEVAQRNAELNGFSEKVRVTASDMENFVQEEQKNQKEYDIVIFDPPNIAGLRHISAFKNSSRKYRALNQEVMKLVAKGGLLLTCIGSQVMTNASVEDSFIKTMGVAAKAAGRELTLLRQTQASADCPLLPAFPEAGFLTALLLRVD